jgi:oligopeptidase B
VSGRYNAWKDRAFSYAWVLDQVGLADVQGAEIEVSLKVR